MHKVWTMLPKNRQQRLNKMAWSRRWYLSKFWWNNQALPDLRHAATSL